MTAKGVVALRLPCPACEQVIDLTAFDLDSQDHGGAVLRCNRCWEYLNFSYSVTLKLPAHNDGTSEAPRSAGGCAASQFGKVRTTEQFDGSQEGQR